MKFKSAVDGWFYLLILAVIFLMLATVFPPMIAGQISILAALAILAVSLGLPIWLLFSTYYLVSGDILHIKSGPFFWQVKIGEIQSATPSHSVLSSPALSLNRIELRYGPGKIILVSPENKAGFLQAIGHG